MFCDALFALAPDVAVLVGADAALAGVAFGTGGEAGAGVVGGVFEGAEAEDPRDDGPAVRDVGDHDGGGAFAGVPIQVQEEAVGGGEIEVAV